MFASASGGSTRPVVKIRSAKKKHADSDSDIVTGGSNFTESKAGLETDCVLYCSVLLSWAAVDHHKV